MENTVGLPQLNARAPEFKAVTTSGPRTLDDYKGKWLILFSHPADFTPVCTTEFIGFAKHFDKFQSMNCELLGLSIDSLFSHLAWMRNIKEKFGVTIPFPIIEDIKMDVARAYGMIHPGAADTQAVRATFFIDPKGVLRAMVYYPMSNGRSIEEFVRLLDAMQTTVLLAFAALPTSSSCYVLAARMGYNGPYVAGLVTLSTVLGPASLALALGVLR